MVFGMWVAGADPGYVKRGGPRSKRGGPDGRYNSKIAQKLPKIGLNLHVLSVKKGGGGGGANSDHTWIRPWVGLGSKVRMVTLMEVRR